MSVVFGLCTAAGLTNIPTSSMHATPYRLYPRNIKMNAIAIDTVGDNVDLGTMAELDTKQSIELGLKAELADLSVLQLQRRAEQNGVYEEVLEQVAELEKDLQIKRLVELIVEKEISEPEPEPEAEPPKWGPQGSLQIVSWALSGLVGLFGLLLTITGAMASGELEKGCPPGQDCSNLAVTTIILLGGFFFLLGGLNGSSRPPTARASLRMPRDIYRPAPVLLSRPHVDMC